MPHTEETTDDEVSGLDTLLDRLAQAAADGGSLSVGSAMDVVGRRSFGPILLLAGLVAIAPLVGDIPGIPTSMGLIVLLSVVQILFGRDSIWIPGWIERRSASEEKVARAIDWLRSPAGFLDRVTRPRLRLLVEGRGSLLIALACVLIALSMPFLEFVPFSSTGAAAGLVAFGLALVARDGLVAAVAFVLTALTYGVVGWVVFG
ncbi:exopolysaccharide biosynthesis protein [Gaopeijia maritima]|uniref:Exopolysaccharide biosynthesis protein n=1 Tax=Gaopeijia maritima TaxID=3119007 RepID=A0ABU9E5H4_9BACT